MFFWDSVFFTNLASPIKLTIMNEFDNQHSRDTHFSKRIRAGKRTYYFDVKSTRSNDFYITITESKKKPGESEDRPFFEKHKLFLYKEDFEKFSDGLNEALAYIRQQGVHYTPSNAPAPMQHEYEPQSSGFSNIDFDDLGK